MAEIEISVLGLNYKTAPLSLRERLAVPAHKIEELLHELKERNIFNERLLLSTCNRTEIYGVGDPSLDGVNRAKQFLSEYSKLDLSVFEEKLYVLRKPDSVSHLFSVASGLDSMVVGETEITGQVKNAYLTAQKNRQTGKILNTLFQRSLRVAKELRTNTDIGVGKVSVASVAVDLAEKIFEKLKGVRVLVLGTGEMSTQVSRAMVSHGAYPLVVSSRHHERARELVSELGLGEAISFEDYESRIKEADVLIASTAAPSLLIREPQVRGWMKQRHDKPLFLIDIALPRNIESSIEKIDNVYLYNIDDLKGIAEKNQAMREEELSECLRRIQAQTDRFMLWLAKEKHFV